MDDAKRKELMAETIYSVGRYIRRLKRAKQDLPRSKRGLYVIEVERILYCPDSDGATSDPNKAGRYNIDQARKLAPAVRNGSGTRGEAVHLDDWLNMMIRRQTELLVTLEAAHSQIK